MQKPRGIFLPCDILEALRCDLFYWWHYATECVWALLLIAGGSTWVFLRGGVLLTSSLNFPLWHSASLDVAALLSAGVPLGSFFLISLSVVSLRRNFGPTQARGGAEETRRVDCLFSRTTETDVSVAHLDASRTQWCLKAYEFLKIQAVDWPTCCFEIQAPLWRQAGDLTRFDSLSNK